MYDLLLEIWKNISNTAIESAWQIFHLEKEPDMENEEEIELEIQEDSY